MKQRTTSVSVRNGSATKIRSLALPGHSFNVVALDGNPVPAPADVPVFWIGTGERVSAIVELSHLGIWILDDHDRDCGAPQLSPGSPVGLPALA